jgi:protein arginine kinase activator
MKCDVCNAEATVFLTQIINGQMTTVNLCESCSKAKGVTDELGFGLAEAFLGAGNTTPVPGHPEVLTCPSCGFTSAQFKKIGRMGCPECYRTFRNGLDSMLANMHSGTRHVGKIPAHAIAASRRSATLAELQDSLHAAVREERYEEAARLKKQIEEMRQGTTPA